MDQRKALEQKRQQYRLKLRQQSIKKNRNKFQQALMKNHLIFNAYNDDLMKAIHQKDYKYLLTTIEDILAQPVFFSRLVDSGILQIFIHLIKHNTRLQQDNQSQPEQQIIPQNKSWFDVPQVPQQLNISIFRIQQQQIDDLIVDKILAVFSKTHYDQIDGIKEFITSIWGLLWNDNFVQIKLMLKTINTILNQEPTTYTIFENLGLIKQLQQLITDQIPPAQSYQQDSIFFKEKQKQISPLNSILLDVAYNYLLLTQRKDRKKYKDLKQKQIVQCLNSPQFDSFLQLSSFNIQNNQLLNTSVQLIAVLIQYIPAYADCITESTIEKLIQLIDSNQHDLEMISNILEVIDSISFYCGQHGLELLYNSKIFDVIDKHLYIEEASQDKNQQKRITFITFIICNIFTSANDRMVKNMRSHPLLDHIFGYVQPGNKLIALARVFDYYFRSLRPGQKQPNIINALFEAVSVLDLQSPQSLILKETITQIYMRALDKKDYSQQQYIENKLTSLGMGYILDNL